MIRLALILHPKDLLIKENSIILLLIEINKIKEIKYFKLKKIIANMI